jgi:hypothetical protein
MFERHTKGGCAMRRTAVLPLIVALGLGLSETRTLAAADAKATASVQDVEWKHLVPPDYDPSQLVRKYYDDVAKLKDDDPRAEQLAEALRRAWESAPVVASLDNKTVKLSGFLVSLEGDGKAVSEFLLVPYFGACIHVPPPPSNQIVLVRTRARPYKISHSFERVSVTGRLRTEQARNDLASASYVIEAARVEPHAP